MVGTGITDGYYPDKILIRGYRIDELLTLSFPDVAYLTIFGRMPNKSESRIINALMVVSVDHGLAPSALISRLAIDAAPESFQGAIAAGILAIGDLHGGAIEKCAKMLQEGVKKAQKEGKDLDQMAEILVHERWAEGERIHGIGHPIHKIDPRVGPLFKIAEEEGYKKDCCSLLAAISEVSQNVYGRKLPVNVDGAIAAIISDMKIDWRLGKAFFIMSRTVGLVSHVYEEMTKPAMTDVRNVARKLPYDGPAERLFEKPV
jgi:citrate synthase